MNRPRSRRSLGVWSFSAGPWNPASPWPRERDGLQLAEVVALGTGFATSQSLGSRSPVEVNALVDQDRQGPLGFSVPREPHDEKDTATRGRDEGLDVLLTGHVESGEVPSLALSLVDCERRRSIAQTKIDDPDPSRWGAIAAVWVLECLELEGSPVDEPEGLSLEDAFDLLDARVSLHAYDQSQRGEDLHRARRCSLAAVARGSGESACFAVLLWSLLRGSRPDDELLVQLEELVVSREGRHRLELCSALRRWCESDKILEWTADALDDPTAEETRHLLRMRVLIDSDRSDQARAEGKGSLEAFPESVQLMKQMAILEEDGSGQEFVQSAQDLWERVLSIDPDDEMALAGRVAGLVESDPEAALAHFRHALELGEVSDRILESALRLLDPPREASEELCAVVSTAKLPENSSPIAYGFFGALLCRCGHGARGQMHLTVAVDRGMPHPFAARAWALQRRPDDFDYAAAIDTLALRVLGSELEPSSERTQELMTAVTAAVPDESDPQAVFLRGVIASRAKQHAEAVSFFEAAHAALPEMTEIRLHLGLALMEVDRDGEAEHQLELCVRRLPKNSDVRHAWSIALLATGKVEEGLGQLRETLKLDPSHPGAREMYDRLEKRAQEVDAEGTQEGPETESEA